MHILAERVAVTNLLLAREIAADFQRLKNISYFLENISYFLAETSRECTAEETENLRAALQTCRSHIADELDAYDSNFGDPCCADCIARTQIETMIAAIDAVLKQK